MSFFFIRPYSSRGIGIWFYVTELHIKRAKRVVKKAECFFQIENLRTLFNLWLTDIFFKRVYDATDSNQVVKSLHCCMQTTVLLLLNGGSECIYKYMSSPKKSCETHIVYNFFYTYMYTKIVSYCLICLIRPADLHRCV